MSLSKKNLDELNNFIKDENLSNYINRNDIKNSDKNNNRPRKSSELEDPSEIFYSLIDNSKTLNETCKVNHLLRNSEKNFININSRENDYSKHLSKEDELYDEFNYLLEE